MNLLPEPVAPGIHTLAGFGADGEDLQIGVAHVGIGNDLVHVKVKIGEYIDLVDDEGIAYGKNEGEVIYERPSEEQLRRARELYKQV